MSWGVEIWDQYEKVCVHTDSGIEFIRRVQTFMEKRIHVEVSYAKELRKLVRTFRRKEEEDSPYSAVKGFGKAVLETNDLAGQRELVAEYMEAEVLTPLKKVVRDITSDRKKHLATGFECLRQLKATMDSLERAKKAYEKASEEAEAALHTREKVDNDPNSTKLKIDKVTTILRQKESIAEECRNTYILQLEKTNSDRKEHFTSTMPAVFDDLQNMNASRITEYKRVVDIYSECQRRVLPVVNTCLDNITAASEAMDPVKDNQQLVEECKTGFPIPGEVEFVEYSKKATKKVHKKNKVEIREDYGHLPPEQQRRKLQFKVDQLEGLISHTHTDKAGKEKMMNVYTENPKMGDPGVVAKAIELTDTRLAELSGELDRFKGYLINAVSRINEKPVERKQVPITARSPSSAKKEMSPSKPVPPNSNNNDHANNSPKDDEFEDDDDDDEEEEEAGEATPQEKAGLENDWDHVDSDEALPKAMLLYDFAGENEDELTCYQHDVVSILENLEDGWLRVRKGKIEGYVPQSYVQMK